MLPFVCEIDIGKSITPNPSSSKYLSTLNIVWLFRLKRLLMFKLQRTAARLTENRACFRSSTRTPPTMNVLWEIVTTTGVRRPHCTTKNGAIVNWTQCATKVGPKYRDFASSITKILPVWLTPRLPPHAQVPVAIWPLSSRTKFNQALINWVIKI